MSTQLSKPGKLPNTCIYMYIAVTSNSSSVGTCECMCSFQRLRILVREGRMNEAIQLGLDLYENKARAVVGEVCEIE